MSAPIVHLRAEQVSDEDRRRIAEFIGEDEDSPVSILLRRLISVTDHGVDVALLSDDAELSPNEVAKLLKMSRPHLLTFMDRGVLPFHRVGTHRRIKVSDVLSFIRGREQGAAIVAEAFGHPPKTLEELQPLTVAERQELDEL